MSNATDDSRLLRQEECEVLESIYPEYVTSRAADCCELELEIPIEFNDQKTVCLHQLEERNSDSSVLLSLSSLPPLLVSVALPASYPIYSAPDVISIQTTHLWLPHVTRLRKILVGMWQPGEGVLCPWIDFIRSGDFLETLSLIIDDTIRISHHSPRVIATLFNEFAGMFASNRFAQNIYPCSICMSEYKGSKCFKLSCSHVFCRSCLEDYWKLCISEGDVGRVGCPDPECIKRKLEASAEEVGRVVSQAELHRWKWLKGKRDMEKDPSTVRCPIEHCQAAVPKPTEMDEESGWARLRSCPTCSFSFCVFCRRTWHGPITPCPITFSEKVVLEYLALEPSSPERKFLERKFGKRNIEKLVTNYEEEQANKQWLRSSTMACPGCEIHVEKSLGCNHMTCAKCGKHFCYRCGAQLPKDNPYTHFSTRGESCYNKLFDIERAEEDFVVL